MEQETYQERRIRIYRTIPEPKTYPCGKCKLAEDCDTICPARAKWWDKCLKEAKIK